MRPQAYTENYRQLRKAGSCPQGREHQLFVQWQMAISESIHTSNIIWTHRLCFRMYMFIQIHVCIQQQCMEQEAMNGETGEKSMEGLKGVRDGRNAVIKLHFQNWTISFHTIYLDHVLTPLQTPHRFSPLPYPLNFKFFFPFLFSLSLSFLPPSLPPSPSLSKN